MTSTPYPPPPPGQYPPGPPPSAPGAGATLSPLAWLVPLAALLAVIGLFTPWFKPQGHATSTDGQSRSGDVVKDALYSFKEGRLGLIAPVVLVVVAVGVVQVLTGRTGRFHRSARGPARSAALGSIVAGVVAAAALLIAYFTLPVFYKFKLPDGTSKSWDDTEKLLRSQDGIKDFTISQGPQVGFWLTAAGAAIALVVGIVLLVTAGRATAAGAGSGQVPGAPFGAPPAYSPPPPAPAQQYGPPPQPQYGPPAQQFGPPAQQYGPPPGASQQQFGQPQQFGRPQQPEPRTPGTDDADDANATRVYGQLPEGYRPPPPAGSGPQG